MYFNYIRRHVMTTKKTDSEPKTEEKKRIPKDTLEDIGHQVEKFASKTADSIKKILDRTLSSRNTVLTIRVDDESNIKLNMLVESGIFRSRSESAAFLINEGIKNQESLFSRIAAKLEKIDKIKMELSSIISEEIKIKNISSEKTEPKTKPRKTENKKPA
jgi:Arc/MetJ-type ribon-helix-helix transcriptional regulator